MLEADKIRVSKSVVGQKEATAVSEVILEDGYLGMGKTVQQFEIALKEYLETDKEVICVNSGTAALHLAFFGLNFNPGDEVLVQSLTFAATWQAITAAGLRPVACEVEEATLTIDLADAAKKITARTKAILPVHYASGAGNLDAIYRFAEEHGLRVVEDAAHAFGTVYCGRKIGSFGDVVCFSFDGIKNITSGEGGAVTTADPIVSQRVKDARLLGVQKDTEKRYRGERSWEFDITHQGYRFHMSNVFAAIGLTQLAKLETEFKPKRQALAKKYQQSLRNQQEIVLLEHDFDKIIPHIFPIRVKDNKRDALKKFLADHNIECGIHYKPNHLLTYFRTDNATMPRTEQIYNELLTLPLHPDINDEQHDYIINCIKAFFNAGTEQIVVREARPMQVVILCGGKGTRLREETEHKPKPMVEIGGLPILWHIMKIYSHYGFNDFVLCLGYKQHIIKEYFLKYSHMKSNFTINLGQADIQNHDSHGENWKITLVDTGEETKKGGRLKIAEPFINSTEFLLTYGDGLADVNIKELVDFHRTQDKLVTFTGVHPVSRYATVEFDQNDNIVGWHEKKQLENYINGGFFVINKKALEYIDGDCEWEEEPMQHLAEERQVAMYKHDGFWHCMDTYRDNQHLQGLWDKNQAQWKIW